MFTVAFFQEANSQRASGRGRSAAASSSSNSSRRLAGSPRNGRAFTHPTRSAIALFSSPSPIRRRWRSGASTQRSTVNTPASTAALD